VYCVKLQAMKNALDTLPNDVNALSDLVHTLRDEVTTKEQKLAQQSQFIEQLLEQIRLAKHQHFGSRSERFNIDQLRLVFNEAEATVALEERLSSSESTTGGDSDDIKVPAHVRKRGGRRPLPAELPRVNITHELNEADRCCDTCDKPMEAVSEKTSEQLDIIPAQVQVLRHVRKTYACKACEGAPKTTPLPPQPIPKSLASPGTLAHVAVSKYVDALPLYRQQQQLKRLDVHLPRSTMARWMIKSAIVVQPLINLLRDTLLAYDIVLMDETRLQVLKEPGKSAHSQSTMWVQRGGPPEQRIILYDYDPSRSQEVPMRLLDDFKGYLQTDGYSGYDKVCANNQLIQLGCWAHARRKFDEALKAQKPKTLQQKKASLAATGLQRIQLLYQIERKAKKLEPQERYAMRQERSVPILNDLRTWLDTHLPVVPPQSALGKAMNYTDRQWPKLITYTLDGRLCIDNNLCENAIRPFVIGRKNFLFADSVAGAKASASLYGLIESAKANHINPYRYLKLVFTELPKAKSLEDIEALMPFRQ